MKDYKFENLEEIISNILFEKAIENNKFLKTNIQDADITV